MTEDEYIDLTNYCACRAAIAALSNYIGSDETVKKIRGYLADLRDKHHAKIEIKQE